MGIKCHMLKTIKVIKSSAGFKYFEMMLEISLFSFFLNMAEFSNHEYKNYVKINKCMKM